MQGAQQVQKFCGRTWSKASTARASGMTSHMAGDKAKGTRKGQILQVLEAL